jgi:hypothetical protein
MPSPDLDAMAQVSKRRAEEYIHIAKHLVLESFGPATEHTHTEVAVALAAAMMQHEGAQLIAEAIRSSEP